MYAYLHQAEEWGSEGMAPRILNGPHSMEMNPAALTPGKELLARIE
jgi:hypothetical protein